MCIPIETVKTDSLEMRFFCFGHGGKTLVILPGLSVQSVMATADAVADAMALFAGNYTVYVFDRRQDLPPVYPVRDMARDTVAAIRALGLHDIYLFGASQGGMIAQVIAVENPDLVRKMVLGSTAARVTEQKDPVLDRWIRLAEAKDRTALLLEFGKAIYPPSLFVRYRSLLISSGAQVTDEDLERFVILAKGTEGFSIVDKLEKIQCPVLVIGVAEDQVLDSDATMEIAEMLERKPDCGLYMYTGYGHAAYDTAPDYKDRIYAFFEK